MTETRVIVAGAGGRMGRALVKAITEAPGLVLTGAVDAPGSPAIGKDAGELAGLEKNDVPISADIMPLLAQADGIVDFTTPASSVAFSKIAAKRGVFHIIGTTGLSDADEQSVITSAQRTVVVKSGNMSLGVNLIAALTKRVAATLGEEFDIEILEMHHNKKVDAPSGTALLLGAAAARGRGIDLGARAVRSREGHTGSRRSGDIGFATLRGGSVVGEHVVMFAGPAERIELAHKAEDRAIFARGAVRAALWAKDRPAGFYSMADVLGLNDF